MQSENIFEKMFGSSIRNTDDQDRETKYRYYKCNLVNTKWSCIHQNTRCVDPNSIDIMKCPAWIPKALDIYVLKVLVKQKNVTK